MVCWNALYRESAVSDFGVTTIMGDRALHPDNHWDYQIGTLSFGEVRNSFENRSPDEIYWYPISISKWVTATWRWRYGNKIKVSAMAARSHASLLVLGKGYCHNTPATIEEQMLASYRVNCWTFVASDGLDPNDAYDLAAITGTTILAPYQFIQVGAVHFKIKCF